ncbi:MAG: hypothetical protein KDJ65_30750 [Anaerolineae bacterium]|nr:hypothetical protein [Anaerolineae bacterium]
MYTERFTEQAELLGTIYGLGVAANTASDTGNMLLGNFNRAVIIIHPMDVNDALDVDIEEATTTASGTRTQMDSGNKDITVATADTTPSVIEIKTSELDVNNGYKYLNVEVTTADTGGGGNDFLVEVWGLEPRNKPVSTTSLDSVTD